MRTNGQSIAAARLEDLVPDELRDLENPQTAIPRMAKDRRLMREIENAVRRAPTCHDLYRADARDLSFVCDDGAHLIVTSPPYWTLKEYRDSDGQLGHVDDYAEFMDELGKVWREAYRILTPGGRLVVVVGDVCLSRRKNAGRHTVVPLHAGIQESCRSIGFDNLAPIIWYKIANVVYEVQNGGAGFLGKPYEPNAVIKNDFEYILMQRKPGGYRKPTISARVLSVISAENHHLWFRSIWSDVTGASTRNHPAPYPVELAERLVRMFSFVGDTVVDPFWGTGSTSLAAAKWGRNSIGVEIDPQYFEQGRRRLERETADLFGSTSLKVHDPAGGP